MDADPWADAPPSPRPSTPAKETSPTKPKTSSPLVTSGEQHTFSSIPSSPTSPTSPLAGASQAITTQLEQVHVEAAEDLGIPETEDGAVHAEDSANDAFDDFDDFDQPAAGPSTPPAAGEDAFGDFGDFEEGDFEEPSAQVVVDEPEEIQQPWHALRLRPMPKKMEVLQQVEDLLSPLTTPGEMTDEPPRQTGGLHQILVSESSREAYAQLCTPPMLKALDWTRSRTRREHLISMGVPVNLDEVDSHRLSSLPPLRITTSMGPPAPRRASVETNRFSAKEKGKGREVSPANRGNLSQSVPASAVDGGNNEKKYGLGSRPDLDISKAEDLCGLEEDQLSLMNLDRLKTLQNELVETSANASALLAWSLQYKDAQTQDSATYNGMISELIANAAKAKSAQNAGSGGVFRRASARRPQSSSGTITPGRVGSPAMR